MGRESGWEGVPGVPAGRLLRLMEIPFSEEVMASEEEEGPSEAAVVVLVLSNMSGFLWLLYLYLFLVGKYKSVPMDGWMAMTEQWILNAVVFCC